MLPEVMIRPSATSWDQVEHTGMNQNQQSTQHQDGHADALYHLDDVLDVVIETHGVYPRSSHGTAKTSPASLTAVGPGERPWYLPHSVRRPPTRPE